MYRIILTALAVMSLLGSPTRAAEHTLRLTPKTVQFGRFDASIPPVLTIRSGDIVDIETASQIDPQIVDAAGVVAPTAVPDDVRAVFRMVKDRGPGPHVLTGPIAIEGAEPGDVLEVRILRVELATDFGFNIRLPGNGALPSTFPGRSLRIFAIDRRKRMLEVAPGVTIPLNRPFLGTMGVAPPPSAGRVSSIAPGSFAGNLDNKELITGSTLFIPVQARGALFSAGDGHAAQGDGEVNLTAIETGLVARLQFVLHKDLHFASPRGETPTHWIAMGLAATLEEAMKNAVRETIDIMREVQPALTREEAFLIASVAVDFRITQVVDEIVGIHGMIPKAIFSK